MSYAQWRISYTSLLFTYLSLSCLYWWFYSSLSGRVKTEYPFSLCLVSLLSSRFTASALMWFPNLLKYLALHYIKSDDNNNNKQRSSGKN
jgi:hypothetical protein